ncbi:helix-turn-helix domain-containing protein [Falsihalocynthiibacter sp. BN13B15]|uniref:helix-turn-helix domain-containing protein n=1 Tax=Falsihalocynthiibacter sp. BN13B15 TaxID=3240871 RepID=UPI003510BA1B
MSQAIAVSHGEFGRAALYRLNKTIITHAHREGHLIYYLEGSKADIRVRDEIFEASATHAIAVSPWEPHNFEIEEGGTAICLVLYIKPMWFLENSPSAEYSLKFGCTSVRMSNEMNHYVKRLTALLLEVEDQSQFDEFLFVLTKASFDETWKNNNAENRKQTYDRLSDFRVRKSLRIIQEKMTEDIEMEHLARSVGLSRPHFFKLFKQYLGVTPNVYMNTLRSERAIEELLNTNKTVTNIAFDLGFSSQASFTRFFSSNVGIAPSEYRRVAHVTEGAFPMM